MSTRRDALVLLAAAAIGLVVAPAGWHWYRAIVSVLAFLAVCDLVAWRAR